MRRDRSTHDGQLWARLRAELLRDLQATRASWPDVQANAADLARFADATAALTWFHAAGALDAKDRAYRNLVGLSQHGDERARRLARSLVWLGLWPGLDRRVSRDASRGHAADTVAAEYATAFLIALDGLNATRVRRVAATIIRNTARLVEDERRRERRATGGDATDVVPSQPHSDAVHLDLLLLRRHIGRIVGLDDADLILLTAVFELTCDEVAARAARRAEAINKRVLRAVERLRRQKTTWRENLLSDFGAQSRVCIYVKRETVHRCRNHWPPSKRPVATKQVGTSLYCTACADFLLAGAVRHLRGWSCVVSGDEGPGICPACLADIFRARGEQP